MLKKIALLLAISSIAACSSQQDINSTVDSKCLPEKNYAILDVNAMAEYGKLKAEGKIKSYFYNITISQACYDMSCFKWFLDLENYEFVEIFINSDVQKGIYSVIPMDLDGTGKAFTLKKNMSNVIQSDYEYNVRATEYGTYVFSVVRRIDNKTLFEQVRQADMTQDYGGVYYSSCPTMTTLVKKSND